MKSRILALTISLLIIALTSAIVCAGGNSAGGVRTEENFGFVIAPLGYADGTGELDGTLSRGYYDIVWFIVLGTGKLKLQVEDAGIMGDTMIASGELLIGGPASFMDWARSPDIIRFVVKCPDFAFGYMLVCYYDAPYGFPAEYYWRADMGGVGYCPVGTWGMWVEVGGGDPQYEEWYIYSDGTCMSDSGTTGTWTLCGDKFTLYASGDTEYRGTVAPGCIYMSGQIWTYIGYPIDMWWYWGDFEADKLPSTSAASQGWLDEAGN